MEDGQLIVVSEVRGFGVYGAGDEDDERTSGGWRMEGIWRIKSGGLL